MHFYKAKWEASTPTKVQINVPTNTDYMVGTELYVKGEKKNITTENVTLSPSPKQYVDEVITLKYGADTEWAEWLGNGLWSVKKSFTVKPHYYVKNNAIVENKIYTNIDYSGWYDTTGGAMTTVNSIRTSTGTVLANIRRYNTTDAQTYGLTSQYSCLQANGSYASEFAVEEGMQIKALFSGGAWVEADLIFTNKVETGILAPDTTVNGIPAFTMKSLDAEADKLYEVEFKGTNTNTTWDAALSAFTVDGDLFEYESLTNNKFQFRVLKDMTIKAPFNVVNNEYVDNGDDYTYLEGKNSANNEIYDGTLDFPDYSIVLSSATNGTCTIFAITKSDIATHSLPSKSSYFIMSAGATYASKFALKAGDAITIAKKSGFGATAPKVNYFQVGEDAYDYKFKLFINEDEQSYGSIDLGGTTPAEVSAIVDEAIAAYDSQLSTVNLSGTFDDDSTFSYNFVIKN